VRVRLDLNVMVYGTTRIENYVIPDDGLGVDHHSGAHHDALPKAHSRSNDGRRVDGVDKSNAPDSACLKDPCTGLIVSNCDNDPVVCNVRQPIYRPDYGQAHDLSSLQGGVIIKKSQ
jgi:hypothetical protein